MNSSLLKSTVGIAIINYVIVLFVVVITLTTSYTPAQITQYQGVLQNIDNKSGIITVATRDGKAVALNINSDSAITIDRSPGFIFALEAGSSVDILADKGKNVLMMNDQVSTVEGTTVDVQGNSVTIASRQGNAISVIITPQTLFKLISGTDIADSLKEGTPVQVRYDPQTTNAFSVSASAQKQSQVEGIVSGISDNKITITTQGRQSLNVTLSVANTTVIRKGNTAVKFSDLRIGDQVHAVFDPITMLAYTVIVQQPEKSPYPY